MEVGIEKKRKIHEEANKSGGKRASGVYQTKLILCVSSFEGDSFLIV